MKGDADVHKVLNTVRQKSSVWRDGTLDMFSQVTRDEADDEALKWAALEKLPTYDRLRRGLITGSNGVAEEIDVQNLGHEQKKILVDRLVNTVEDNEKFLMKLKNRIERVGIEIPTVEVRYEHLNVEADVYVGKRALPTAFNFIAGIFEGLLSCIGASASRKKKLSILHDVSGIIKPRRMTLLLGPPSSGKTTLLLALAGRLGCELQTSGRVTYNGHDMHEFIPQRTSAYVGQHDVHFGEMTVRETLAFSARCQGAGSRYEILAELSRREKVANIEPDPELDSFMKAVASEGQGENVVTEYIMKLLGLNVCADVLVGNEMDRGISGGQRKRVTIGEMLVGPALALFMDDISTGLDSTTTFQFMNSIRQFTHVLNGTAVVSLLQPSPEIYELFDDIILLADGHIIYHGPCNNLLDFFESMGFKCPERKGVAEFLQEVISRKDQQQYWAITNKSYHFVTIPEFVEAFRSFHIGKNIVIELVTQYDKRKTHQAALSMNKYGVGKKEIFKACLSREYLLMRRNSFLHIFKLFQLCFVAIIAITTFSHTKMHKDTMVDGTIYLGSIFFSVTIIMFTGYAEIGMTILRLPIFFKQRNLLFYPAWAYGVPGWILKIPISFLEVGIWVSISYYAIGFDPDIGRLFKQYLLYAVLNHMASGLFRLIGAASRIMIIANTCGALVVIAQFTLGGFVLSRQNLTKWWTWGYWISPLMYAQNGVSTNEFYGHSWSHVMENTIEPLGVAVMRSRGLFMKKYWYWLSVVMLLVFSLLYNVLYLLALSLLNPIRITQAHHVKDNVRKKEHGRHSQSPKEGNTHNGQKDIKVDNGGNILPFVPLSISFQDIRYYIDMPQEMKDKGVSDDKLELLKGVSGVFRPGILTALMGASGAGKTTLMDVLAGRKTRGYITGEIKISGYPKKQKTFTRIFGYCEQNDIHSPYVTVYESLLYSAWLRLSNQVDHRTIQMFVEEIMELVELTPLKRALVGFPDEDGLPIDQRKRLTIAVELVANPSIIFLDEPTSGLDARAASVVIRTVRNIVDTGRTVVCTIHQPNTDIFESFDEVFLMKQGGEEIYVGPLGHYSCDLIKYFEGIQGVSKIKGGYNSATWMLEVSSSAREMALGIDFAEIYRNSYLYKKNKALIEENYTAPYGSKDLSFQTKYSQSYMNQFRICLWKQKLSYSRNPRYTVVRMIFTILLSVLFGSMYWRLGSNKSSTGDLFNAMGSMYVIVLAVGLQNASSVQPVVDIERPVFYRERAVGMYSALPYAFAQIVIEVPYIILQTLVYGILVYLMIGFEWEASKFFWYLFFVFFTLLYFTFYGMMMVALTPNYNVACVAASMFYSIWSLFSGLSIPRTRIPIWWRWYYWCCPVAWSLYGLLATQYGDVEDVLSDNGLTVKQLLEEFFGFRHDFIGVVAIAVVGFTLLFAFTFSLSLKMINYEKR